MHRNKLQGKKLSKYQRALLKLLNGSWRPPLFPFPHFGANNSMDVKPSIKTSGGYCFPAALETLLSFLQILPHVKVVRLLAVLLLPLQSWQGLPRTAQWGHLSPMAICAQVLLIRPFESTFLKPLPKSLLPHSHRPTCQSTMAVRNCCNIWRYSVNKRQITKDITFVVLRRILLCSCSPSLSSFDVCAHRCVPERLFHCQTVYPHYSWPKWQVRLGRAPWRVKEVESGGQVKARRGKEPSVSCSPETVVQASLEQCGLSGSHADHCWFSKLSYIKTSSLGLWETSLQMLIMRQDLAVFSVVSGEKWKNFSMRRMQGNARLFHFYAKKRESDNANNKTKGLFVISSRRALYTLFWCALSTAQMDDPSLSEDIGTPVQSDSWDRIHHPDKRK